MTRPLPASLRLEPGERPRVALFFTTAVLIGAYWAVGAAVGDTLFLSAVIERGSSVARWLPWVYVLIAVGALAATWAFGFMEARLPRHAFVVSVPLALALSMLALRAALAAPSIAVRLGLAVWVDVAALLSITLFFSVAGDCFVSRDAKRLYGIVWGGLPVGVLAGGAAVSRLAGPLGVSNLLPLAAALLTGTALLYGGARRFGYAPREADDDPGPPPPLARLLRHSYTRHLAAISLLTPVLFVCADVLMKLLVSGRPPVDMAAFFGVFYVSVGLAQLLVQLILARRAMTALGGTNVLLLFPALVGAGAALFLAIPTLAVATGANFVRATMGETLEPAARELHWLALPPRLRRRVQRLASGALVPLGQGLGGALLLGLSAAGFGLRAIAVAAIATATFIVVLVRRLRSRYIRQLAESLRYHLLDDGELERLLAEPGNRAVVRALRDSSDPTLAAFAREVLNAPAEERPPRPSSWDAGARERVVANMELIGRAIAEADGIAAVFLRDHMRLQWDLLLRLFALDGPADAFDRVRRNLWTESRSEALDLLDALVPGPMGARLLALAAPDGAGGPGLSEPTRQALARAGGWLRTIATYGTPGADDTWIQRVAQMRALPLFAGLGADVLAPVAALAEDVDVPPDGVLFVEGAPADALYLVTRGRLAVRTGGVQVATIAGGEALGELSLLDEQPRSASASALEACRVLRVPAAPFHALLETQPALVRALLRTLAQRLRVTQGGSDGGAGANERGLPPDGDASSLPLVLERAAFLRSVPLFASLPPGSVAALARLTRAVPVFAGEEIVRQGERGDTLYIVQSGRLSVSVSGRPAGILLPRDFLGEMSLLDGSPRSATVRVEEDGFVLGMHGRDVDNLLAGDPRIGIEMLRGMAHRLRRATNAVRSL
ncbi:MAG TPA: cyclic nucleotide-binding domain-containing protein [Gemmatimonadaceae bacterium]|nr:cyclic nucleotide-binding domain-containing protein [Gemmatimonadaceae bacterium]